MFAFHVRLSTLFHVSPLTKQPRIHNLNRNFLLEKRIEIISYSLQLLLEVYQSRFSFEINQVLRFQCKTNKASNVTRYFKIEKVKTANFFRRDEK